MYAFVDYKTTNEEINNLINLNLKPIFIPKCEKVYDAINGHPDIQLNILKNSSSNKLIIQKNIGANFTNILDQNSIEYIVAKKSLNSKYPQDIILNAYITENYFVHNLKYTDENLLCSQKNKIFIDVPQGYTKCSILPVREKAIITSDKGIFNSLSKYNFDILLIPPGDILLPSLDYGFIGGVGGMIPDDRMAFFGELEHYRYGEDVKKFLYKYDVKPVYLKKGKLIDRGSLLTL